MLESALRYLELGWNVIPVNRKKRPRLSSWEQYQSRKVTESEVRSWWTKWPNANIAVITGNVSGIVVVDVDSSEGLHNIEPYLNGSTLTCQTGGGGKHLYFSHPGNGKVLPNAVGLLPGVDLRADGGYVVVPPSVHQSRKYYRWTDPNIKPSSIPKGLLKIIEEKGTKSKLTEADWESDIIKGKRDEELTRRAGRLLQIDVPPEEALVMLKAVNKEHCKPPLTEEQVEKIVKSIAGREQAKRDRSKAGSNGEVAEPFRILDFRDTLNEFGHGELTWTIKEWLPQSTCGIVVAPPGNFKTWLLLDLAVSIATGKPFLGEYPVEDTGPVLIIQQEDPFPLLFNRVGAVMNLGEPKQIRQDSTFTVAASEPNIYWHPDRMLNFKDKETMDGLLQVARKLKPKLIILDPLYSAADSKDYMAEAAQAMLHFKRMRDELGCSFIVAHHTTKKGKGEEGREGMWGSAFLNAWLETGWQIRPTQTESAIRIKRHFKNTSVPILLNLEFDITDWSFHIKASRADSLIDSAPVVSALESQQESMENLDVSGLATANQLLNTIHEIQQKEEG